LAAGSTRTRNQVRDGELLAAADAGPLDEIDVFASSLTPVPTGRRLVVEPSRLHGRLADQPPVGSVHRKVLAYDRPST